MRIWCIMHPSSFPPPVPPTPPGFSPPMPPPGPCWPPSPGPSPLVPPPPACASPPCWPPLVNWVITVTENKITVVYVCLSGQCLETARTDKQTDTTVALIYKMSNFLSIVTFFLGHGINYVIESCFYMLNQMLVTNPLS